MAVMRVSGNVGLAGLLIRAALVLLASTAAYWVWRGVQVRLLFRKLRKQGIVSLSIPKFDVVSATRH